MSRASILVAAVSSALAGCGSLHFVDVESATQGSRVEHIVLHFTVTDFAESMRLLTQRTERPVSAHYLVPENGDPSYPRRRLRVHRLVDEARRASHAGRSHWRGVEALNGSSIGIELVNRSACSGLDLLSETASPEAACEFLDFDPEQIDLTIDLLLDILERHPRIDPVDIVGHADIAADRRLDPGPKFPWRRLYERGIGAWYDDATMAGYLERFEAEPPELALLQRALAAYGYDVGASGEYDAWTRAVIRVFQMHFRPENWSGAPDAETAAIAFALLEKYRPEALSALEQPSP